MIRRFLYPFLVVALSLFCIRQIFIPGFFPMHDDAQVARVVVMSNALQNGQFPVRIVSDLGYNFGYPLFNFYAPLPYYIGSLFHLSGVDALTATKAMIAVGCMLGSISVYFLASYAFGPASGLLSAVVFTYFPYRAVQLFVRGAVGELWAVSIVPIVMFSLLYIVRSEHKRIGSLFLAISLSFLILSHTVFGYITVLALAAFFLLAFFYSWRKPSGDFRSMFTWWIIGFIGGLGLSAFFWLPAIAEMRYTNVDVVIGSTADFRDHFICWQQLWESPWGFGGSQSGCNDGMSLKIGKLDSILFILSVIIFFLVKKKTKKNIQYIWYVFAGCTICLLFLTLRASSVFWTVIPYSSFIQYPWRFLGMTAIVLSVAVGFIVYRKKPVVASIVLSVITISTILVNGKLFRPQYIVNKASKDFETPADLRFRASSVSDEYLPKGIKIPKSLQEAPSGRIPRVEGISVIVIGENERSGIYDILASEENNLKLNMAFVPGWTFFMNGQQIYPAVVDGQPSVILSAGSSLLELRFVDTPVRTIGNWISLFSVIGLLALAYGKKTFGYHRHSGLQ